jgi:methionine-rich copper-binding protein CopC
MVETAHGGRLPARAAAVAALALLAFAAGGAPAFAHATFTNGTPGPGDAVCAPTLVSDYFAQHIQVSSAQQTYSLWVTNANGDQVDNNDNAVDPSDTTHMTVSLPPNLSPGAYTVHWATLSDDDGDQANGDYSFTIRSC